MDEINLLDELTEKLNKSILSFSNFSNNINDYKTIESLTKIKKDILKFSAICNKLNNISNHCNNIKMNIANILNLKLINMNKNKDILYKIMDKKSTTEYNLFNEEIILEERNVIDNIIKTNDKDNINNKILNIDVNIVEDESQIKNVPISFIKNTNQYAIRINNVLIKGNIGNIYDKSENKKENIMKCNKKDCNTINCKFYHENTNNNFTDNTNYIRNYYNYSWHYIKKNKNKNINYYSNKKNTRLLGSRDTILSDLLYSSQNELELRNSQLMHDILIYQILNNYLNL